MNKLSCMHCDRPLPISKAVLVVNRVHALQSLMEKEERNRQQALVEGLRVTRLADMPEPGFVEWQYGHLECTSGDYVIELSRINTVSKALAWTLHLQEKQWFRCTNAEVALHLGQELVDTAGPYHG